MRGEIIKEITKIKIGSVITNENVLAWAKRVGAQTTQSTVMNSLTEAKGFDEIKISRNTCKDNPRKKHTDKNALKADVQVLQKQPTPETIPSIWEDVHRMQ